MHNSYFWIVKHGNAHVICNTTQSDREEAKRIAGRWLGNTYSDKFIVTPLTTDGDRVKLDVVVQV
jgi:hypothetical protein